MSKERREYLMALAEQLKAEAKLMEAHADVLICELRREETAV